ncbi:MAG TPA: type I polyketide synthase [Pseudonocardiaceae bacterium]|nr:type I polyketide synthase [Pseudonocardiaceae bacterium]
MVEPTGLEVAIVGAAGRFPGADSVDAYWDLIASGRPAVSTFTDAELDAAGVPEHVRGLPSYVRAGGVLAGAELFDPAFFGMSPRDAAVLDPQQRVFLECAWHALENAGHAGQPQRHVVGTYASASMSTYLLRHLLPDADLMGELSNHELVLANDKDTLATRTAYHLNLTGPALSVQTACSSSLVAVHLACQGLLAQDCDIALAGGVSVRLPQTEGYRHLAGGILSPDGTCRPYDASAAGTVGGNGVGVVVLRRLADALADRDTVLAVIRGSAINNDGAAKVGFTAPSVTGQASVIRTALAVAEVDPATIGYVEGHGTGTALGDPIEVAALTEAYRANTDRDGFCAIGSVKALIGHLDAAAGIAGLLAAVRAVRSGTLPPSPHFVAPNPELDLDRTPFYVTPGARPWPADLRPRRAGISSFGMGGTNAHVILEQPPTTPSTTATDEPALLVLSARTGAALDAARTGLTDFLAQRPEVPLADVAHTLHEGRRTFAHRAAAVGGEWSTGVADGEPGVVFVFPGQGAQHARMARGLGGLPTFTRTLAECAYLLRPHLDLPAVIEADDPALDQTRYAQPALFAVEYALARQWQDMGVRPVTSLGHSVGEYVAACLAGTMTLPDALALVAARGRLMHRLPPGAMVAVNESADRLAGRIGSRVSVAAINAPDLSVLSGPVADVERVARELTGTGVRCRRLHTAHAFHSPIVDDVLDEFAEHVARVPLQAPGSPFVSTVTGEPITDAQAADPGYWVRQLREPVRFSQALRTALRDPHRVLLEVGPGTGLAMLARRHRLAEGGHIAVSSLRHPQDPKSDLAAFRAAAGRLWANGVGIDLAGLIGRGRRVPLPGYPFQRQRCWYDLPGGTPPATEPVEAPALPAASATEQVILGLWRQLLGVADIGLGDDFFELGGHSLLATQIVARLGERLAIDLPAGALFEAPTVARLAAYVDDLVTVGDLLSEADGITPEELRAELDLVRANEERS